MLRYAEGIDKPILQPQFPMFFDLGSDPGERYNLFEMKMDMGWMYRAVFPAIAQYPNIPTGADFKGYQTPI